MMRQSLNMFELEMNEKQKLQEMKAYIVMRQKYYD